MQGRNRDDSKLSKDPRSIRARIRRKKQKFDDDVDRLLEVQGYKPVSEWDLEELARGKPKDAQGRFKTAKPKWITPKIQEEVKKRFREETLNGLAEYTGLALKVLGELLESEEVDNNGRPIVTAKDRIDIAKFVVEHTIGKAPAKVEIGTEAPWRNVLAESMGLPDAETEYHPVIEGDWEDDE